MVVPLKFFLKIFLLKRSCDIDFEYVFPTKKNDAPEPGLIPRLPKLQKGKLIWTSTPAYAFHKHWSFMFESFLTDLKVV